MLIAFTRNKTAYAKPQRSCYIQYVGTLATVAASAITHHWSTHTTATSTPTSTESPATATSHARRVPSMAHTTMLLLISFHITNLISSQMASLHLNRVRCDWLQPRQTGPLAANNHNAVGHAAHVKAGSESSKSPSDMANTGCHPLSLFWLVTKLTATVNCVGS